MVVPPKCAVMGDWERGSRLDSSHFDLDGMLISEALLHSDSKSLLHVQAMKDKVEGDYNASQVSAVTQGLDGTPVILIQVPFYVVVCCAHRHPTSTDRAAYQLYAVHLVRSQPKLALSHAKSFG